MPTQTTFPLDDSQGDPNSGGHYWDRFLPVPPNGKRCPVSGMGHGKFYCKVINGAGAAEVRLLDLKDPSEKRSTQYYHAGDLYRWLDRLARERHDAKKAAKKAKRRKGAKKTAANTKAGES